MNPEQRVSEVLAGADLAINSLTDKQVTGLAADLATATGGAWVRWSPTSPALGTSSAR